MPNSSELRPIIDLREILEYSDGIFSIVGIFLSFLLLYLILYKTGSRFKEYKKLLLQNCITDLIYNFVYVFTRSQVEFKNGHFFLLLTSTFGRYPKPYNTILGCLFLFAAYFCVSQLPVQFFYRYLLIVKSLKITTNQYILLLLMTIFFPLLFFIPALFILWPDPNTYSERGELLQADIFYYKEIPNYITADIRDLSFLGLVSYAFFMITVAYGIVLWTSWKVWKYLKSMENHMSVQTKDVNRQMSLAFILQATLPLFVLLFPIAVTCLMLFARANISGIGISVSLLLSWIPIVNSLMTIIVVKSYRNEVLKVLCHFKKQNIVNTATSNNILVNVIDFPNPNIK